MELVVQVMLWDFRYIGQRGEKSNRLPVKEENMAETSAWNLRSRMRVASLVLSESSGVVRTSESWQEKENPRQIICAVLYIRGISPDFTHVNSELSGVAVGSCDRQSHRNITECSVVIKLGAIRRRMKNKRCPSVIMKICGSAISVIRCAVLALSFPTPSKKYKRLEKI